VRHVVEENARVLAFADALSRGDVAAAGELMTASHRSQRDLFKVSVPEVDALVEELLAEGAAGGAAHRRRLRRLGRRAVRLTLRVEGAGN
jgi:galactokinase